MSEVNPYQAPQTEPVEVEAAPTRVESRGLAVLIALLANSLPGAGLLMLGRPRLARFWLGAGLGAYLLVAFQTVPRLAVVGIAFLMVLRIGGIVATCVAKAGTRSRRLPTWALAVSLVIGALAFGLATRAFVVEAFQIPAASMVPSLLVGDHLFVRKYQKTPARGDVIVFKYPGDPSVEYIKRVVGLPGETVAIQDNTVLIDGRPLVQRALDEPCPSKNEACEVSEETADKHVYRVLHRFGRHSEFGPVTVPPGEYFVLGDNRDNSNDSRIWGGVRADLVKGVASMVWWSRDPESGEIRWSRAGTSIR